MEISSSKIRFLTLLVTISNFISLTSLLGTIWYYVNVIVSFVIICSIFPYIRKVFREYKIVNIFAIVYCISICSSTYLIQSYIPPFTWAIDLASPFVALMYSLQLLSILFFIEVCNSTNKTMTFILTLFKALTYALIIADIFLFTITIKEDFFLLGNKFTSTYLHIVWLILYAYIYSSHMKNFKIKFTICSIFIIIIAYCYDCSTSMMAVMTIAVCTYIRNILKRLIKKAWILPILLVVADLTFVFLNQVILKWDISKFIIVDLLHRDMTLTTRTAIYEMVLIPLSIRPIWGFGCYNTYAVVPAIMPYPNLQNGILNSILEIGIIGTFLYVLVLYLLIKKSNILQKNSTRSNFYFMLFILSFIVVSLVEVNIDNFFLCWSTLVLCLPQNKRKII